MSVGQRRAGSWLLTLASLSALAAGCSQGARASVPDEPLAFVRDGAPVRSLRRSELLSAATSETVSAFDPYYNRPKRYRALPLREVLGAGFGAADAKVEYVLRARDGYTVPLSGQRLLEDGGFLAVEDLDAPGWEPIGPQRANPGPYYLVWAHADQQSLETHPRPWQLASIEIAPFEKVFPHTAPTGEPPGSAASRGYALFRESCIRCHAINREGGHTGPDLNLPQSVVEYRPTEQIRAYIRNPLSFRYGNMPPHPGLSEQNLDELVAYFQAMKDRKHDTAAP